MKNFKVFSASRKKMEMRQKNDIIESTSLSSMIKIDKTHTFVFKLLSLIGQVGVPVLKPSSFSAFVYHSGILTSLPGTLCN